MLKEYPETLHFYDKNKYVHKLVVMTYCINNPIYANALVYTSMRQKFQFFIYSYIET